MRCSCAFRGLAATQASLILWAFALRCFLGVDAYWKRLITVCSSSPISTSRFITYSPSGRSEWWPHADVGWTDRSGSAGSLQPCRLITVTWGSVYCSGLTLIVLRKKSYCICERIHYAKLKLYILLLSLSAHLRSNIILLKAWSQYMTHDSFHHFASKTSKSLKTLHFWMITEAKCLCDDVMTQSLKRGQYFHNEKIIQGTKWWEWLIFN